MPTYNGERFIKELLDSLCNQTYVNLEIIILDDCSKDSTIEICQEYAVKDKRIKLFENKCNLGVNANFENGLKMVNGDYIFLCDQDDIWDTNKVEKMVYALDDGYDLVYCNSRVIDGDSKIICSSFHRLIGTDNVKPNKLHKYIFLRNITNGCSMAFKKELINEIIPFPNDIIYDWWILIRASSKFRIGVIKKPLMSYRIHDSNAVGLSMKTKDRLMYISETHAAIDRLLKVQHILNDIEVTPLIKTLDYYECRFRFLSKEITAIKYIYISICYLINFPWWYKNIIKNILEDCFTPVARLALVLWKRINLNKV